MLVVHVLVEVKPESLVRAAQASSSMKGNPIRLTDEVLGQVLAEAY